MKNQHRYFRGEYLEGLHRISLLIHWLCLALQQYLQSSLPGLYCPCSYVGEASILDSSYVALTFVWVRVVSFMEFNLVLFFFQMPSSARFGCVFHCYTVSQSWSPGSRAGLPRAHPVKDCAPAAHSGLISYACQFSCHKYSEFLCMVFGRDRYTVKTCV